MQPKSYIGTAMNHLINENSAYLKQHKDNPVHWRPYGKEALDLAKAQNKPIFLSIGYSSCHWCHVMAHESFEDQNTADFLNENFINIKVDREEFPDIDQFYQKACQFFGRNGGWPLSAFLTPELAPYFVGTYFPLERRAEMPSFMDVLHELKRAYDQDKEIIQQNSENALKAITENNQKIQDVKFEGHFPHPSSIFEAMEQYESPTGGYGDAPKFPSFAYWEWAAEQMLEGLVAPKAKEFYIKSVDHLFLGGIFDQAKGGIHRYSTDNTWLVPHFEKMLYDQSGALRVLSKASLSYPEAHVLDALMLTLNYLKTEMQSESGYFFSAQDADSEGQEGLYFTFTLDELDKIFEDEKLKNKKDLFYKWMDIHGGGNFEHGLNILNIKPEFKEEVLKQENWLAYRHLKELALNERRDRIPPMTDNKGVASWNFMLLSALCDVFQYCRIPNIKTLAKDLIESSLEGVHSTFVVGSPGQPSGATMLRHVTTLDDGLPYFEDYVNFCEAQLRLYEITSNESFRSNFVSTMNFIINEFYKDGKFFTRALAAEKIEPYPNLAIESFDMSFRSPLSVYLNLVRRYTTLTSDTALLDQCSDAFKDFKNLALNNPVGCGEALRALSYPDNAYRVLKVPRSWVNETKFINFICFLMPRFVLSYEDAESEWQLCTWTECQVQGSGLEDMIQKLSPKEEKPE